MTRDSAPESETWHCRSCGAALAPDATSCDYCSSPVGTARCGQCFQVSRSDSEFCTRCGTRLRTFAASRAADKPCPACRRKMVAGRAGEFALASCEGCGSVWLDRAVFTQLCREREAQATFLSGPWAPRTSIAPSPSTPGQRYRPCPVCAKFMNRSNFAKYSGILLDTCRDHGTFFDPKELPALVHFIHTGGLDRVRDREREALKEEERRLSTLRRISPTSAGRGMEDLVFRDSTLDALLRELFNR